MKIKLIVTIVFLAASFSVWALGTDSTNKALRKQRSSYIKLGVGLAPTNFRDFSTSPLVYRSPLTLHANLGFEKEDSLRYTYIGVDFNRGVAFNSTNDETATSTFYRTSLTFTRLYAIPALAIDKFHVKVGGYANITANYRLNPSLGNNTGGQEIIGTLFASAQGVMDISRTKEKNKKFLFIKYHLNPIKRQLDYLLNIGVLNTNYRNGFAYIGQSDLTTDPELFDDYKWRVNGFRMNTSLRYTKYFSSGNAMQFNYTWDAYFTGDKPEKFEMAQHILAIAILFNTKK